MRIKERPRRRGRGICIARAALVMLNFELGQEEDIICTMDLREHLSATLSTSSTATIVTNNIESKEQCHFN